MNTLAPKLVLTPLLVASTSATGRRWGPALSGWLIALPLTSGPIALFIAIDSGADLARQAAAGSLVGSVAQIGFATAYLIVSRRLGWIRSLLAATAAFVGVALIVPSGLPVATAGLLLVAVSAFLALPAGPVAASIDPPTPPAWDIPARVVVATILVVAISALAPVLGGHAAGTLATFPVYVAVLTTFTHVTSGTREAAAVLRGLVTGLLGFGAFFLSLGWLLGVTGIGESFAAALAIALVVRPRPGPCSGSSAGRPPDLCRGPYTPRP